MALRKLQVLLGLIALVLLFGAKPVAAQTPEPEGYPVYIYLFWVKAARTARKQSLILKV